MDVQEREREVAANAAQCSGDMFLTLVPYFPGLGPARPDVGDVQRAGILSSTDTAFMRHQEGSDEPWPGTIPFSSSLDRDPAQGSHAGTGVRMLQPATGGGLMWRRRSRRAGARSSCPRVSRKGMMRRRNGTRHLPQSLSDRCQNSVSAGRTAAVVTDALGRCTGSFPCVVLARRVLRAEERLRCVRSTNPSRILDFSFGGVWRYCPRSSFMTACRCFTGGPISSLLICSPSSIVPPQSPVLE